MTTKAKEQAVILKGLTERVIAMGATKAAEPYQYKLALPTKAGILQVHFDPDPLRMGELPAVTAFCRFVEPEKAWLRLGAVERHRLARNTGKWNWHGLTIGVGCADFLEEIENLLPELPRCIGCGRVKCCGGCA